MTGSPILWRRLDSPGHESARLFSRDSGWHLQGTAIFAYNRRPCRLDYHIVCDARWQTRSATVSGWVGDTPVEIEVAVDSARRWRLNGKDRPAVMGCIDLDLNFSPSTNLLPIRRLKLEVGQQAQVRAAWLRFPTFNLVPLEQVYRRLDAATYRYGSRGGKFVRDLHVDAHGFVVSYPGIWQTESGRDVIKKRNAARIRRRRA